MTFGDKIYLFGYKLRDFFTARSSEKKYVELIKKGYKDRTGKELDIDNPVTFNEKIQWLKLFDCTTEKTLLADKYLVRDWVAKKIGEEHLIPQIGSWRKFDEIDFDKLPESFVLKCNHASGWNVIVPDKKDFDYAVAKDKFDTWMNKSFAFYSDNYELQYMNIPRRIVAEEYIADLSGGDILDYRFFCFGGEIKSVWLDIGSGTSHHKRNIYDTDWNLQSYKVSYANIDFDVEKPAHFDEMKKYAEILSEGFAFVRVDFYYVGGKVLFGEMTFTPQGGTGKWEDESINKLYGDYIKLPEKKKIPRPKRV